MTAMERLPISVTLIVTVDGHTLTFTETGEAKGNRDWVQRPKGYTDDDTLEAQIRLTVMAAAAIGMSYTALDRAIYRARALGDPRAGVAAPQPARWKEATSR